MKFIALAWLCLFVSSEAASQNFTFSPADSYSATLQMQVYGDHQIDIAHDAPDTAYISWRVMEQEYPAGWDVQLCDWQHCYTYVPDNGDMLGVPTGSNGYVRLLVNPFDIPGSGHFMLWIFPTDSMEQFMEIHFYFNTIVTDIAESLHPKPQCRYDVGQQMIQFMNQPRGIASIYCISGRRLKQYVLSGGNESFEAADLSSGIYLIVFENRLTTTVIVP
ncbi:MAG: hypothetical protein ACKVOR_11520 [Flavobacteriales bacterium]